MTHDLDVGGLPRGVLLAVNCVGSLLAMFLVGVIAAEARALCKWPATLSCPKSDYEPWVLLMIALAAALAGIWVDALRGTNTRREVTRQLSYLVWGVSLLVALLATAQERTLERGHLVLGALLVLFGLGLSWWAVLDQVHRSRTRWIVGTAGLGTGVATIAYLLSVPAAFEAKWEESRRPPTSSTVTEQPPEVGDLSPLVDEVPPSEPMITPTPAGR